MATDLIVLLTAGSPDSITADAIRHLAALSTQGLIRPFLVVEADAVHGRTFAAFHFGEDGRESVDLREALSAAHDPRMLRIAALAAVEEESVVEHLVAAAGALAEELRRTAPGRLPIVDARVIAPGSLLAPSVLTRLFKPGANANIIVIPEDRGSHNSFAYPLSPSTDKFSANLAYETASLTGLWAAMESAWIDIQQPGVIDGADSKVLLAQSQTRIMDLPPPAIEQALSASLEYPVPLGFVEAPDQRGAAARVADFLYKDARDLHFVPPTEFKDRREDVGLGESFGRIGREFVRVVATFPPRLAIAASSTVKHVAEHTLAHVLGDERTIKPIFSGQSNDFASAASLPDIDAPLETTLGVDGIDQNTWTRFVDSTLAVVDGGGAAGGLPPLVEGAQRFAIVSPEAISIRPSSTATVFADQLLREQLDTSTPTLVGRLAARIHSAQMTAKATMDKARGDYFELLERVKNARHGGTPAWLKAAIGIAVAFLVVTIAIRGGLAEWAGIDSWSGSTRVWIGAIGALIAILIASASLAATLEAKKRETIRAAQAAVDAAQPGQPVVAVEVEARRTSGMVKVAWTVLSVVVLLGALGTWRWFGTRVDAASFGLDSFGLLRVGEFIAISTVTLTLAAVAWFALSAAGMSGGAAALRLAFTTLVVYLALAIIAGVVDQRGWYGSEDFPQEFPTRWVIIQAIVLLALVAMAFGYRTREHFRFNDSYVRLVAACDSARHCAKEHARLSVVTSQFLGTAVALARLVWYPFGALSDELNRKPVEVATPALKKMQVARFDIAPDMVQTLYSRIRTKLTDHGWLRRQYSAAMDGFQRSYLMRNGKNPGGVTQFRPEADRTTGPRRDGLRWEFAEQLVRGDFDPGLKYSGLIHSGEKAVRDLVLSDGLLEGPVPSLRQFVHDIVSGEAAALSQDIFVNLPIVMAGDDRARFNSNLWWPSAVGDDIQISGLAVHDVEAIATDSSTIVMAVRTEHSQAFPLRRLPIAWIEPDNGTTPPPPPPPDEREPRA